MHQPSSGNATSKYPAPTAKSTTVAVPAEGTVDGPVPTSAVTGDAAQFPSHIHQRSHVRRSGDAIHSGTAMPAEPLMWPQYAAQAMPYPAGSAHVPWMNAPVWNRPFTAASTMNPVQMMMYQHQQNPYLFLGQHHQYQLPIANAIDHRDANSNDSTRLEMNALTCLME